MFLRAGPPVRAAPIPPPDVRRAARRAFRRFAAASPSPAAPPPVPLLLFPLLAVRRAFRRFAAASGRGIPYFSVIISDGGRILRAEVSTMFVANLISYILVLLGAVNWGLYGIFNFNLVSAVFRGDRSVGSIVRVCADRARGAVAAYLYRVCGRHTAPRRSPRPHIRLRAPGGLRRRQPRLPSIPRCTVKSAPVRGARQAPRSFAAHGKPRARLRRTAKSAPVRGARQTPRPFAAHGKIRARARRMVNPAPVRGTRQAPQVTAGLAFRALSPFFHKKFSPLPLTKAAFSHIIKLTIVISENYYHYCHIIL